MRLPQLTFTRFLAALLIIIYHTPSQTIYKMAVLGPLVMKANSAVSYFFLLSGFILVVAGTSKNTLAVSIPRRKFWVNRFSRIYPLYLFALLLTCALAYLIGKTGIPGYKNGVIFLSNLFLLQAWVPAWAQTLNYPGWSLSVEAFFYLTFPVLYSILIGKQSHALIWVATISWLVNVIVHAACMTSDLPHSFALYFPLLHLSTFVCGICTGVIWVRHHQLLIAWRAAIGYSLVVLAILYVYLITSWSPIMNYYHNGLLAPLFVALILYLAVQQGKVARWLSHPKLVYLGDISYGIYLLQVPVGLAISYCNQRYIHLNTGAYMTLYTSALILFAAFCYEWIEMPSQRLLRCWLMPTVVNDPQHQALLVSDPTAGTALHEALPQSDK